MPTEEMNGEIIALEKQFKYYENLFNKSIANNVIFYKTRIILRALKRVDQKLNELKEIKETVRPNSPSVSNGITLLVDL